MFAFFMFSSRRSCRRRRFGSFKNVLHLSLASISRSFMSGTAEKTFKKEKVGKKKQQQH